MFCARDLIVIWPLMSTAGCIGTPPIPWQGSIEAIPQADRLRVLKLSGQELSEDTID